MLWGPAPPLQASLSTHQYSEPSFESMLSVPSASLLDHTGSVQLAPEGALVVVVGATVVVVGATVVLVGATVVLVGASVVEVGATVVEVVDVGPAVVVVLELVVVGIHLTSDG
jgi:hypothetical protein